MLSIRYINKEINHLKPTKTIDLILVNYEISEEDMIKLSQTQSMTYEPLQVQLYNDSNVIDLVVDNIEGGRILEGGLTANKKFILTQYIILKGLNEFLKMKQLGGSDE